MIAILWGARVEGANYLSRAPVAIPITTWTPKYSLKNERYYYREEVGWAPRGMCWVTAWVV